MEKTIEFITQVMGLMIITLLSFMMGFNTSYKYNHLHVFIDFLVKCYAWVIEWFWSLIVQSAHFLNEHQLLLSQYDEKIAHFFAGFVFLFGVFILLETCSLSLWKSLLSRSTKRS